ncbi:hypothetical protein QYM36_012867 [Artemia franciscana]|uniref:Sec1 family domain-containing protein 1 n=1 Tax=Artemia franciscana TaxID=6661 RepID=A0AA88L3Q1_ARTSF|nr:hypothetical protein QYM36_012867 [Artemia franciscana]
MFIRKRQKDMLKQMLNFNKPLINKVYDWKMLIYDQFSQEIIAHLFLQKELDEMGILKCMSLHSSREVASVSPSIYFCQPTPKNIARIIQDMKANLYCQYYFNFTGYIARPLLEKLAQESYDNGIHDDVHEVCCHYTSFISPEENLFTLRSKIGDEDLGYYNLVRPGNTEEQIDDILHQIVEGLFDAFATIGRAPIIRCPKGNIAEKVAERLNNKIKNYLRNPSSTLFKEDFGSLNNFCQERPLLVILERDIDLATCLHHAWTYQTLIADVLDYKSGFVSVKEMDENTGTEKKINWELNDNDKFWIDQKGSPIPFVTEVLQKESNSLIHEHQKVRSLDETITEGEVDLISTNRQMTTAVSSLPQLVEKKKQIEVHISLVQAIMDQVKTRHLNVYFELETKIMSKPNVERSLSEILSDPSIGSPEDKLRLFLIYLICTPSVSTEEYNKCQEALVDCGCNLSALNYIKQWKTQSRPQMSTKYPNDGSKSASLLTRLSKTSATFMDGIKSLLIKQDNLTVTRIVDHLMELKHSTEVEDYRYFDPLLKITIDKDFKPISPFQECVVFLLSSGNYTEYQNLLDYCKVKGQKIITYGTTCLENGAQFLGQLNLLGQEV